MDTDLWRLLRSRTLRHLLQCTSFWEEPKPHMTTFDNLLAATKTAHRSSRRSRAYKALWTATRVSFLRLFQASHCPSARVSHSSLVDSISLFTIVMRLFIVLMKVAFFLSFTTYAFAAPVKSLNPIVCILSLWPIVGANDSFQFSESALDEANLKRDIVLVHGVNDLVEYS